MSTVAVDTAVQEFAQKRSEYLRFTAKLDALVRDLLFAKKLDFHLLEARTKEIDSLRAKISRSSKTYQTLAEITDLCGLRIITYYQDHADAIGKMLQSEFVVDEQNSLVHNTSGAEFGYKSAHFVITLNEQRATLLEWQGLSSLCAEIQVRTVLQHAWAAISHKLQYKREEDVPLMLKRKLFRLSALFELADDEFVSLRDASGAVTKEIIEQLSSGNRQLPLDTVSLGQLLASSPAVAELCAYAEEAGFSFEPVPFSDEDADSDPVSELLQLAAVADLRTVEQLEGLLDSATRWARTYLVAQYTSDRRISAGKWHVTPTFVCELVLLRSRIEVFRLGNLLKAGYSREVGKRIYEVAQNFVIPEA